MDTRVSAVPKKTQQDTQYCIRLWEEWCQHRQSNLGVSIPQLTELQPTELQQWLSYFILELHKKDGSKFTPDSLHHIYWISLGRVIMCVLWYELLIIRPIKSSEECSHRFDGSH